MKVDSLWNIYSENDNFKELSFGIWICTVSYEFSWRLRNYPLEYKQKGNGIVCRARASGQKSLGAALFWLVCFAL